MAPDITARFAKLERSLRKLHRTGKTGDRKSFLVDDDLQDVVLRNFHVAIEALIDLGNRVVSSKSLTSPGSNAEIFTVLSEAGLMDGDLASKMVGWAGFRNVVVHGYADVDFDRVWDILTSELDDLYQAARALEALLDLDTDSLGKNSSD